jgi:hypothetical protein
MRSCIVINILTYESTCPRRLLSSHCDSSPIWCAHRGNLHRPRHNSNISSMRGKTMLRCGLSSLLGIGVGHCQVDERQAGRFKCNHSGASRQGYVACCYLHVLQLECRVSRLGLFLSVLSSKNRVSLKRPICRFVARADPATSLTNQTC